MSRVIENRCVNCDLPWPCLGNLCSYKNVPIDYCDNCGAEGAKYILNGDDLCEDCVKENLESAFNGLTLLEKAKALEIDLREIDN